MLSRNPHCAAILEIRLGDISISRAFFRRSFSRYSPGGIPVISVNSSSSLCILELLTGGKQYSSYLAVSSLPDAADQRSASCGFGLSPLVLPSACNGGSSFLIGIRAVHDAKIPTVASYRRFPELRFRSLTGGTAVIDAYFSKKKPVIWNLATSLFSSFRTSTSITQERLPLLTSRATARRVFPEPGRMNETAALMAIHLSP